MSDDNTKSIELFALNKDFLFVMADHDRSILAWINPAYITSIEYARSEKQKHEMISIGLSNGRSIHVYQNDENPNPSFVTICEFLKLDPSELSAS
jgi:hypothetical protein